MTCIIKSGITPIHVWSMSMADHGQKYHLSFPEFHLEQANRQTKIQSVVLLVK